MALSPPSYMPWTPRWLSSVTRAQTPDLAPLEGTKGGETAVAPEYKQGKNWVGVDGKGLRFSQLPFAVEERSHSVQGCEPGSFFLAEKVGECPSKRLECGSRVPNPCTTDFSCEAHFKCCPFSCGNLCIDPYEGTGIQVGGRKLAK